MSKCINTSRSQDKAIQRINDMFLGFITSDKLEILKIVKSNIEKHEVQS